MALDMNNIDSSINSFNKNVIEFRELLQKVGQLLDDMSKADGSTRDITRKIDELKKFVETQNKKSVDNLISKNEKMSSQMVSAVHAMETLLEELRDVTIVNFEDNMKVLVTKSFEANKKILEALNDRVTTITNELQKTATVLDKEGVTLYRKTSRSIMVNKLLSVIIIVLLIAMMVFEYTDVDFPFGNSALVIEGLLR